MYQETNIGAWRRTIGISSVALVALVLSLSGSLAFKNAQTKTAVSNRAGGVLTYPIPEKTSWPSTLDPAQISLLSDNVIVSAIFAGLVKQSYNDKTKKFDIVPDLAQSWTISKNGDVYTFKIRSDAAFSDGTKVTAQDFVTSLTRALDPKEASSVTYYLFDVAGAADFANGKAKSISGLKALDASTLQITLWHPVVYFLYALSYPTGFVVKSSVAPGANMTRTPSLVVGAGPWMLKGGTWQYGQKIALVPNMHYYGAKNFKISELDFVFPGSTEANYTGYKSGQFPMTEIPAAYVAQNKGQPDYHETVVLGDVWYAMNVKKKPFTDIHFRRAVAYGIDRNAIANGVLHGTVKPFYGWYPAGILGYDPNILKNDNVPYYNPTRAKQELALAKKDLGTIPAITFEVGTEHNDRVRGAIEVQSELKKIGITMSLHLVPGNTWSDDGNHQRAQFIFDDWFDDYPDSQDFSDYLIKTGAGENFGAYSNPAVDKLFEQGAVERDTATRERIYKQAQLIVLQDAAIAMLYQDANQALITQNYHGLELNPSFGPYFQPVANDWASVSVS